MRGWLRELCHKRRGYAGTVNLTEALPELSGNLQIEGPGADQLTVRRDSTAGAFRIFTVGQGSEVSISGITISGGNAPNSTGGGIHNREGILTVSDSTISGNSAGFGGGVFSDTHLSGTEKSTITNSTISGNSATNQGGGVYNFAGLSVIEHSTITNNTAPNGEGSGVASFGQTDTRTEVLSTIISANQGTDVDFTDQSTNSFDSKGYNLIGDGNATAAFNQSGDQSGLGDPKLGALADNGGPTNTHALLATSPARDTIPQGTNGCGTTFTEDQRGVGRPQASACDIGSFELTTITVNSTEDTTANDGKCTLREAITSANNDDPTSVPPAGECANGSGADTITFALPPSTDPSTISLNSELLIADDLQIDGPGASALTISGNDASRVFFVNPGAPGATSGPPASSLSVAISNLTISNGLAKGGNGVKPRFGGGGGGAAGMGGAIFVNNGSVTISGVAFSGNRAQGGDANGDGFGGGGGGVGGNGAVSGPSGGAGGGGPSGDDESGSANGGFGGDGGAGGSGGGAGGGGAGLGGAIFIRAGSLTLADNSFTDNAASGLHTTTSLSHIPPHHPHGYQRYLWWQRFRLSNRNHQPGQRPGRPHHRQHHPLHGRLRRTRHGLRRLRRRSERHGGGDHGGRDRTGAQRRHHLRCRRKRYDHQRHGHRFHPGQRGPGRRSERQ